MTPHTTHPVFHSLSPFGAEVQGLDLRDELPPAVEDELRDGWYTHGLLLFRDQDLTKEQQLRVATIFGEFSDQANPGGVNFITNLYAHGVGPGGTRYSNHPGALRFHLDHTFCDDPVKGIMLYAIEVPPPGKGGDTLFSDTRIALRLLPDEFRERIAALKAVYNVPDNLAPDNLDPRFAVHPLVFAHPKTGQTLLFLSRRHADRLVDVAADESESLMDEIASYIERPEIIYRHRWKPQDLVVWDNLAIQHARDDFDPAYRRHLRRTQMG